MSVVESGLYIVFQWIQRRRRKYVQEYAESMEKVFKIIYNRRRTLFLWSGRFQITNREIESLFPEYRDRHWWLLWKPSHVARVARLYREMVPTARAYDEIARSGRAQEIRYYHYPGL